MGFDIFAVIFIFYLLVIFPSQTRIRVNIKVVRCLKYRVSLVPSRSVLRRNSDNTIQLIPVWPAPAPILTTPFFARLL